MICPQQHADPNGDYVAAVVGSALGLNCQLGYVTNGPDATCQYFPTGSNVIPRFAQTVWRIACHRRNRLPRFASKGVLDFKVS